VENQINQLLAGQLNQFDEQALQEELDMIMATGPSPTEKTASSANQQPSKTSTTQTNLPNAPTHLPQTAVEVQEEDTREPVLA
jgi:hypothetical protein